MQSIGRAKLRQVGNRAGPLHTVDEPGDTAHDICSRVEFKLRKNQRIKLFLAPGRRKIHKRDLPRLASEDFFRYVANHYVKTRK